MRVLPRGSEQTLDEQKPVAKGDRRQQLRADEQSYELIVPMKVGNPGSRKGRPRYPLEGRGEQVDASTQRHIAETQNSGAYVKWN